MIILETFSKTAKNPY